MNTTQKLTVQTEAPSPIFPFFHVVSLQQVWRSSTNTPERTLLVQEPETSNTYFVSFYIFLLKLSNDRTTEFTTRVYFLIDSDTAFLERMHMFSDLCSDVCSWHSGKQNKWEWHTKKMFLNRLLYPERQITSPVIYEKTANAWLSG